MIVSVCAWHQPAPIVLGEIDDGKPGRQETHTICAECTERMLGGKVPAQQTRRELAVMVLEGRATLVTPWTVTA